MYASYQFQGIVFFYIVNFTKRAKETNSDNLLEGFTHNTKLFHPCQTYFLYDRKTISQVSYKIRFVDIYYNWCPFLF